MIEWKLEKRKIKDLKPHPNNPRKLSKHDADHLKKSLEKFGLVDKAVINSDNQIIGGHQRIQMLKRMGVKEIEVWVPDREMDEKDVLELNIRLNRNVGDWDWDILANEWDPDALIEWGFEPEELMGDIKADDNGEKQREMDEQSQETKSSLGDCFSLGVDYAMCNSNPDPFIIMVCVFDASECDEIIKHWAKNRSKIGKTATVWKNGQICEDFE